MSETPILVVIELVSVHDPVGLKAYQERASALIGPLGGSVIGHGGTPVEGELGFAPLAIQRWPSERAFRAWLASDAVICGGAGGTSVSRVGCDGACRHYGSISPIATRSGNPYPAWYGSTADGCRTNVWGKAGT